MTDHCMTAEALEAATHRKQSAAQARILKSWGVPFRRRPDGTLAVSPAAMDEYLNPKPKPAKPAMVFSPFTPDGGMRAAWADTALGKWQRVRREETEAREALQQEMAAAMPKLTSEQELTMQRQRQVAHAGLVRFHAARRRVAKLRRTPSWADQAAIRRIYEQARALTVETGIPHHVDHTIPLQGKLVSGLHVEGNLQIITGSENSRKRNRFEVDA